MDTQPTQSTAPMATRSGRAVRVVIVDDEPAVRHALARALGPGRGAEVVGLLGSADDLMQTVVRTAPDVVLLDLDMPGRSALEAVQDLRYRGSVSRVVILSAFLEGWQVRGALAFGALGYVAKDDAPEAVFEAIAAVMQGRRYLSPTVAGAHPDLAARDA